LKIRENMAFHTFFAFSKHSKANKGALPHFYDLRMRFDSPVRLAGGLELNSGFEFEWSVCISMSRIVTAKSRFKQGPMVVSSQILFQNESFVW
jgi:hypothetical protein